MFESFVADNYQFLNLNEFFDWIDSFLPESPIVIDEWIKPVSTEKLYNRLKSKIIRLTEDDKYVLQIFVDNLDEIDRKIIYYKNNLIQFIDDHKKVKNLYCSIFEDILNLDYYDDNSDWRTAITKLGYNSEKFKKKKDWDKFVNKEYFMDPNDVPASVRENIQKMCDILISYVYVPYLPFDRVYRLKNFKRRTVTVIDTDSNILALDTWVNYTIRNIMDSSYGRDKNKNVFIAVNTLTYVLTEAVSKILALYAEYANIPEEFRPKLNMKNEFEKGSFKTLLIDGEVLLGLNYQHMLAITYGQRVIPEIW